MYDVTISLFFFATSADNRDIKSLSKRCTVEQFLKQVNGYFDRVRSS